MDWFGLAKIVSILAAATFGVTGLLVESKDDEKGREKSQRKRRIAIGGILLSATISLWLYKLEEDAAEEAANTSNLRYSNTIVRLEQTLFRAKLLAKNLDNTLKQQTAMLEGQRKVLTAEDRLRFLQLRGYYPLEPLSIYFVQEFPMDQKFFKVYSERLTAKLNNGRWSKDRVVGISDMAEMLPQNVQNGEELETGELVPLRVLLSPLFEFNFTSKERGRITFKCVSPDNQYALAGEELPGRKETKITITLAADFVRRVIIQEIDCENPGRTGDITAISSVDLIGRNLSWNDLNPFSFMTDTIGRPRKIAFVFPYDYRSRKSARYIPMRRGQISIDIIPEHIGLGKVIRDTPY